MSNKTIRNLFATQWEGQALAEYMPLLTLIGMFSIAILTGVGLRVSSAFTQVSSCLDAPHNGTEFTLLDPAGGAQHLLVEIPTTCLEEITETESEVVVSMGDTSYLEAALSGGIAGAFDAWCVDYSHAISVGRTYRVTNSNDPSSLVDRPQNLPVIYWLANFDWQNNGYEMMDVQGAIWLLIDDDAIKRQHLGPRSVELAELALASAGSPSSDPTIRIR